MPVDDSAFQAAAEALIGRVNRAARRIATDGAALAEASAKQVRSYTSRTGSNRRSIHSDRAQGFGGVWRARMGPTMIYSRRLELGFQGADRLGRVYHQRPRPYVKPGLDVARSGIRMLAARRVGQAVRGQEV